MSTTADASARDGGHPAPRGKSRVAATWIAVAGGAFGLHHFYLQGGRRHAGWLYPLPSLLGLWGWWRASHLGHDDVLAWWLLPLGGASLSAAMLCAIVYGLTPGERWAARHGGQPAHRHGWLTVLGVIVALLLGTTALLSSIAYGLQRYFEASLAPQAAVQTVRTA